MKIRPLENEAALRDAGLLILRVVVGGTFLVHGLDKLIDLSATESYFASLGIPAAGLMAPFVAATETVGGALLLLGLATRLVGLALAGDMLVALLTEHIGDGFFVSDGGIEFVLLLGSASLALVLTGAGRFSADAAFGVTRRLFELVTRLTDGAPRLRRGGAVATTRPRRLARRLGLAPRGRRPPDPGGHGGTRSRLTQAQPREGVAHDRHQYTLTDLQRGDG